MKKMPASCDELKKLINFGKRNLGDTKKTSFTKTCGWPKSKGLESQDSDEMLAKLNPFSAFSCPQPNSRKCQCDGDVCPFMGGRNAGKNLKSFLPCGNNDSLFRDPTGLKNRKPRVPCVPNPTMEEVKKRCKAIESQKNDSSGDETKIDLCCSDSDEKVNVPENNTEVTVESPNNSLQIVPERSDSLSKTPKQEQQKKTGGNCPPTDLCRNFFCVIENVLCSFLLLISTILQAFACLIGMPPGPCPCRESVQPNEQRRVSKPSVDRRLSCCCNLDGTYFHNTNAFSFVVDWMSTAICCLFSGGGDRMMTSSKHSNVSIDVKTSKATVEDKTIKSKYSAESKTKSQIVEVKPTASAEERAKKKTLQLPGLNEPPHVHDIENFVLTNSYLDKSVFGGQGRKMSSKSIIDEKKIASKPPSVYTNLPRQSTKVSIVPQKSKSGTKGGEKKTLSSSTATDNVSSVKHASTSPEKSMSENKSTSSDKLAPSIPAEERTKQPPVAKPPSESSEKSKSESKSGTTESIPSITDQPAVKKTFHQTKRISQDKSKLDSRSALLKEPDEIHKTKTHHKKSSTSSHSKTRSVPKVSTIEEETLPAADHDVQRQGQVVDQASTVPEVSEMSKSESKGDTVEESVSETILPQRKSQFAELSDSQERLEVKNTTPEDTVPPIIETEFYRTHSPYQKHSSGSQDKRQMSAFPNHGPRQSQLTSHRSKHRKKSKSKSSSNKSLRKTSSKASSSGGQKQKIGHSGPSKQASEFPEESESRTGVGKKASPNVSIAKEQLKHSYLSKEANADPEKSELKSEGIDLRNSSISTIGDVEAVRLSNIAKKTSQLRMSRSASKSSEGKKTDSGQEAIRMSNIATKVSKARIKSKGSKEEEGGRKHSRSKRAHKAPSRLSIPKQQPTEAEETLVQMSSSETVSKMESNQQLSVQPSTTNQEGEMDYRSHIKAQIASQSKLDSDASSTE